MEKITYTAPNLMDWVVQIKAGAATVKVHFIGGAITAYGVTPASYTTANPFIQKVIEQSTHFKEKRIQIGRRVVLPEPAMPKAKPKVQEQTTAIKATDTATIIQQPKEDGNTQKAKSEVEAPVTETNENSEDGITKIDVSCLQDAQDYLQQNFNVSSYKVRTCSSAQKAASEHGVMFVGGAFIPIVEEEDVETENEEN